MIELTGKYVEVMALDIIYTGKLVEVDETEVHLETDLGWVIIPMSHIAFIRGGEEQ